MELWRFPGISTCLISIIFKKIDHKEFKLESTYQQNLLLPVVCPRDQSLVYFMLIRISWRSNKLLNNVMICSLHIGWYLIQKNIFYNFRPCQKKMHFAPKRSISDCETNKSPCRAKKLHQISRCFNPSKTMLTLLSYK